MTTLSPKLRKRSCSACSIIRKKATKCIMPAASVSLNSTRRVVTNAVDMIGHAYALFTHLGQERHEASPLDRQSDGVLADGHAAALPPADDPPVPVDQLLEQLDVFVIDEHRPRADAIDPDRVLFLRLDLGLRPLPRLGVLRIKARGEGHEE